jgi:hypothetical protein
VAATFVRDSSWWYAHSQPDSDRDTVGDTYRYSDPKCHTHSHTYGNAERNSNSDIESDSDFYTNSVPFAYVDAQSKRNPKFHPKTCPDSETQTCAAPAPDTTALKSEAMVVSDQNDINAQPLRTP